MATSGQLATLKADITITRATTPFQGSTLGALWAIGAAGVLAQFYAQVAAPQVLLWKPAVPRDLLVNAVVMAEYLLLTDAKRDGWFVMTQPDTVDTTISRVRQNFVDIFGGASVTMANLTAIAKKDATYGEALFTVSGGSPGTGFVSSFFGQSFTTDDISAAMVLA